MPRIPVIEQTTQAPLTVPSPRASAPAVSNAVGEGLAMAAKGADSLGDALRWQDEQDAKAWAANALSKAHLDMEQSFQQHQEAADVSGKDFTPKFLETFDKYKDETLKNAPDDASRKFLSDNLVTVRTQMGSKAVAFEAAARGSWRMGQVEDAIDNTSKAIAANPTPDTFKQLYAQQKAVIDTLQVEPKQRMALSEKLKTAVFTAYGLGAIQSDPEGLAQRIGASASVPASNDFAAPRQNSAIKAFEAVIDTQSTKFGVDPNFMRAQLMAESSGNPNAVGPETHTGSRSLGMAQFQPETAKRYGIDPMVPEQAIQGQAAYMSDLLGMFGGDYRKAAAAYNWGEGNVQKAVDAHGENWLASAPTETRKYVGKIFGELGTPIETLPGQIKPEHVVNTGDSIIDAMPFDLRLKLLHAAQTEVQKRTAIGKADLAQDLRDATTSLLTTGSYPNMQAMSRDRFVKFLGPEQGQREFEAFQNTAQTGQAIQAFNAMPAAQISQTIQAAAPRAGQTVTPEAEANYRRLADAGDRVLKARDDDPVAFGVRAGVVPNEPLSLDDKFPNQIAKRAAIAKTLSDQYGTRLALFSKSEAENLGRFLQAATPERQLATFHAIYSGVGDLNLYAKAIGQLRPDSPVTAMAGALVGIDAAAAVEKKSWFSDGQTVSAGKAARYMLQGEALLNPTKDDKSSDGKGKAMPMPSDEGGSTNLRSTFQEYAGASFRNQPKAADDAYQGFRAVYAALSAEEGDYSGNLNDGRAQKAAKIALGVDSRQSSRTYLPPYGMSETRFRDLAAQQFAQIKEANKMDRLSIDDIRWENAGRQGRYLAQVGAGYLLGADGRPVAIDIGGK